MKHRDLLGTLISDTSFFRDSFSTKGAFLTVDEPVLTGLLSGLGSDKGRATTLAFRSGSVAYEDADSVEDKN